MWQTTFPRSPTSNFQRSSTVNSLSQIKNTQAARSHGTPSLSNAPTSPYTAPNPLMANIPGNNLRQNDRFEKYLSPAKPDLNVDQILPVPHFTEKVHKVALSQIQHDGVISRKDGLQNEYLHFDLGGEGAHHKDGMRTGFDTALNFNSNVKPPYMKPSESIPAHVSVQFGKPYPVADNTADEISMQGAPFDRHNMNEIARILRPGGAATLWVDEMPRQGATFDKLAEQVNGKVIYPDPSHPKHDPAVAQELPAHLRHDEQATFGMHAHRVVVIAGEEKPVYVPPRHLEL